MSGGSNALNPLANPGAWDVLIVGGSASPGLCKISECRRKHEWDQKKGKGVRGATLTFVGVPLATFTATFRLWDDGTLGTGHNHFEEWASFLPSLKYDATKKQPQAIDVYHPALADIDVHSVVAESIGQLEPVNYEGTQYYEAQIDFIEYSPPPKQSAVGTPSTSDTKVADSGDPAKAGQPPPTAEELLAASQAQLQAAQQAV